MSKFMHGPLEAGQSIIIDGKIHRASARSTRGEKLGMELWRDQSYVAKSLAHAIHIKRGKRARKSQTFTMGDGSIGHLSSEVLWGAEKSTPMEEEDNQRSPIKDPSFVYYLPGFGERESGFPSLGV